jgi:hypothetical protein
MPNHRGPQEKGLHRGQETGRAVWRPAGMLGAHTNIRASHEITSLHPPTASSQPRLTELHVSLVYVCSPDCAQVVTHSVRGGGGESATPITIRSDRNRRGLRSPEVRLLEPGQCR